MNKEGNVDFIEKNKNLERLHKKKESLANRVILSRILEGPNRPARVSKPAPNNPPKLNIQRPGNQPRIITGYDSPHDSFQVNVRTNSSNKKSSLKKRSESRPQAGRQSNLRSRLKKGESRVKFEESDKKYREEHKDWKDDDAYGRSPLRV